MVDARRRAAARRRRASTTGPPEKPGYTAASKSSSFSPNIWTMPEAIPSLMPHDSAQKPCPVCPIAQTGVPTSGSRVGEIERRHVLERLLGPQDGDVAHLVDAHDLAVDRLPAARRQLEPVGAEHDVRRRDDLELVRLRIEDGEAGAVRRRAPCAATRR